MRLASSRISCSEFLEQQIARLLAGHAGDALDLGQLGLAEFVDLGAGFLLELLLLGECGLAPLERI